MKLEPKTPPGRANRKARAYQPEIARLRSEGHTCEAIRQALADTGFEVSLSTVQREAARAKTRRPVAAANAMNPSPSVAASSTSTSSAVAPSALAADPRSGKEIAACFTKTHHSNPLVRARRTQ